MQRLRNRPVLVGVLLAALLAFGLRFYALGWRMPHWDEGRVLFRTMQYAKSGEWSYSAALHGPFVFHVNRYLLDYVAATDFVARAPVALVGSLLPLSAWLFRERLRGEEVVAFAFLLAANPVLLYYSRYMRSDLLVGAFCLVALGFAVRFLDDPGRGYLYAAVGALALAFTTKENVLVYLGLWAGSLALVADHRLLLAEFRGTTTRSVLADWRDRVAAGLRAWWVPILVAAVEFFVVVVLFYAPRPDLWNALADPTLLPGVVEQAVVGSWEELWSQWVDGSRNFAYLPLLENYVRVLEAAALATTVLAVVGFLIERYSARGGQDLVAFATYWGVTSVFVYPIATDIANAAWLAVHAVVPLTIPAAVALGAIYRRVLPGLAPEKVGGSAAAAATLLLLGGAVAVLVNQGLDAVVAGETGAVIAALVLVGIVAHEVAVEAGLTRDLYPSNEEVVAGVAVVALVLVAGQVGFAAAETSYIDPQSQDNRLTQYGQMSDSMRDELPTLERVVRQNEGTDVLFYGSHFSDRHVLWRLPFPWYLEAWDAEIDHTFRSRDVGSDSPPVVIAPSGPGVSGTSTAADLDGKLDGYERLGEFAITLKTDGLVNAVVYVDADALDRASAAT